jgi:hypothetical protein
VLLKNLIDHSFDVNPTSLKLLNQSEILHKPIVNLGEKINYPIYPGNPTKVPSILTGAKLLEWKKSHV